ncbi:MAG: hypothetical protein ACRBB0_18215 [Pelagimonas sp.]|uniref:hypothetical protein n=1 Tax=Pelagimonas sp. TaxID=2073170 RepID=UPI003D6BC829
MRLADDNSATTLSLTATPPYDVDPSEWRNYTALCGPVDAEISVPELVRSGDLCPHQDLVFLAPSADANAYRNNLESEQALFEALARDEDLLALVRDDPWIAETELHANIILENPERFSAMIVFLRHNDMPVPTYARRVLQVNDTDWPELDWPWLESLFREFPQIGLPETLVSRLKSVGALRHDKLTLPPPAHADRLKLLRNDQAKLDAVQKIFATEYSVRGDGLRMAILLDRIGKSGLRPSDTGPEFNALGVFRHLLDVVGPSTMAILTGQLAVLPDAMAQGLAGRSLPGAPGYTHIDGADLGEAVNRVNRGFASGEVVLVVGTHAYLGQGWDAPALNALVLGTRLKSFVAVNQLRGRALRSFAQRPDKVAHIWHMAVVPQEVVEGEDIALLKRRFDCFVRLDRARETIHSEFSIAETVSSQNRLAIERAGSGAHLIDEWQNALLGRGDFEAKLTTRTMLPGSQKRLLLPEPALSFWGRLGLEFGRAPSLGQSYKVLDRVAGMMIASLSELGDLPPLHAQLKPIITWDGNNWQVGITSACKLEEEIFHEAIQQVFNPVHRPRYVISLEAGLWQTRYQYFAVPDRFGSHKDRAHLFWRNWQGYVGRGRLVFTRSVEGRAILQAARMSSAMRSATSRTMWQ